MPGSDSTPKSDAETGTIVFLFGAGCSADGGSPLMGEFMGKAREYSREPQNVFKADYERLRSFRQECLRICYVFDRWWENIEDLYTQANLQALAGLPDADALCDSIKKVIWDVYHRQHEGDGYKRLLPSVFRAKKRWLENTGPRPVVITTNYDVQLETVWTDPATLSPLRIFYPGSLSIQNAGTLHSHADSEVIDKLELLEVVKLHGSVNWWCDPGNDQRAFCDAARYAPHTKDGCFAFQQDPQLRRRVAAGEIVPLIVPPTLGKTAPSSPISQNWNRAIYNLRNARLLIIAGYSFPETDSFMTRLLAEGIKGNDDLEQMVIINNNTNARWLNHVNGIFTRSWMKNSVLWVREKFEHAMHSIENPPSGFPNHRQFKHPEESGQALACLSKALWG